MEILLEILKILIPAAIVFATVYFMLKQYFEAEHKRRTIEIRQAGAVNSAPLKMQAYERLVLFLERISPDHLAMRTQKPKMSARAHHAEMLRIVREEFDHNVTQQLYISSSAWRIVKQVKEEVIRIVNVAASKTGEDATAIELTKTVLGIVAQLEHVPTEVAKEALKKEFRSQF